MKRALPLLLLIFSAQAYAGQLMLTGMGGKGPAGGGALTSAIARTGSCSAATTTCTLSATNGSDLKIVFAYRNNSTTAPSLPGTFTNISTGATAAGGTTGSYRIGCAVATSSADTGVGTWSNASDVVAVSYSGTLATTTANCVTSAIGGTAFNNAKTSTTIDYPTITMTHSDNTSWVAAFSGNSAGGICKPSGNTQISTVGSGPAIMGSDTNAGVTAWADATCSDTSSTWMSAVVEVLGFSTAANRIVVVQDVVKTCASGTTCAIDLAATTISGNTLVFMSGFTNDDLQMVSSDKGGTLVPCVTCSGNDNSGGGNSAPAGYIIGATAATTPVTITFSKTATSKWVRMYELHPTGGTITFDASNSQQFASGTSPVAPNLTLSGSNDFIATACAPATSCTAAASPYDVHFETDTDSDGYSFVLAPANGNGPTWTLGSNGVTRTSSLALGFSSSSCANETYVDFEGTNNTSASTSTLNSDVHGYKGAAWTISGTAPKYQTAANQPLVNSTGRLCDGTTSAAAGGSTGFQVLTASGASTYLKYVWGTPTATTVTAFVWYQESLPATDTTVTDLFSIQGAGGADFATVETYLDPGGMTRDFRVETTAGVTTSYSFSINTWYGLSLQYNKTGNHVLKIYNTSLSLLATITNTAAGTQSPVNVFIGNAASSTPTTGFVQNFDSLLLNFDGTYPLLP